MQPKVVFVIGIQPSFFGDRLKQLQAAGADVVSYAVSLPDPKKYGITYNYIGLTPLQPAGALMADWVVARKGSKAEVVFYSAPEVTQAPPAAWEPCPLYTRRTVQVSAQQ